MRVLVAKDDFTSRMTLTTVLRASGFDVLETINGQEAWDEMRHPNAPKLAIIDWMMPEMDGLELTRRIRTQDNHFQPYIIMVSAKSENADIVAGLDAGADDYLVKPFDQKELEARIRVGQRMIALQEAKHESDARAEAVLQNIIDGIITINAMGIIEYVNPAMLHLFGYTKSELLGQNVKILMPEPVRSEHDSYLRTYTETVVKNVLDRTVDVEALRKDGTKFPITLGVSEVRLGKRHLFTGIIKDQSEKKEMEQHLRQANKMEALGTMAGGIAHDFNNILAAQMGYTHLAQNTMDPDSKAHRFLREVDSASERAKELVAQILSFSHQRDLSRTPINIHDAIREALGLLSNIIPADITLEQQISPDCAMVLADASQIHQIVMNLTINAYHAVREQGGSITIELDDTEVDSQIASIHKDLQVGSYALLRISDTGCGMDTTTLTRIFEPYFTTKGVGEGTGMGLSSVLGIVNEHDGAIIVESDLGEGSTFNVYFPVYTEDTQASREESSNAKMSKLSGEKERILIVDDEVPLVEIYRISLEDLGYLVSPHTNSIEAWHTFQANPDDFDLVITDYTMPGLTGLELSKNIHTIRPELPILMCTGFSDMLKKEDVRAVGIYEYLKKPIMPDDLAHKIRQAFDKKGY